LIQADVRRNLIYALDDGDTISDEMMHSYLSDIEILCYYWLILESIFMRNDYEPNAAEHLYLPQVGYSHFKVSMKDKVDVSSF
jgi:hypothetical protein